MNNYIPLYRKYRPQSFADLIGQESVVKTLSNAINLGKISHAYLFTGPRGTGKTSSARILAKSLNCVEGPTVSPCGKCPSCIDIAKSNSVDVIEIDAASNRKVEDARNLLEKVHFVPVAGKYKVYIIDEVHMLTTEAFNTLLKTLEEPPPNLVFILATTEAHKVLNTIISRCQRFDFKRVSQGQIIQRLREIAQKESVSINDKALSLIAKKAYGGMRDALGLLDQASVLANQGIEITETDILTLFGSLSEDTLHEIAQNFAQRDTNSLMQTADRAVQSCDPVNVLRELVNYFKSMLIIKTSNDLEKVRPLIDFSDSIIPEIKIQSASFETDEIVQIIEKLCEYERTIKTTHQQQLWLEIALLSICHRQDMQLIKDLEQRIERLESGTAPARPQEFRAAPPQPASPAPLPQQPAPLPVATNPVKNELAKTEPPITTIEAEPVEAETTNHTDDNPATTQPEIPAQPVTQQTSSSNNDWGRLLSAFKEDSVREFCKQMIVPIELSEKKIILACKSKVWIPKAEKEKKTFETAAMSLYGTAPSVIIRELRPDDKVTEEKKNPEIEKPRIDPPNPKETSQIAIDVESREEIETEVKQGLDEVSKPVIPVNISDQCKMVLEVFNGKIIE